MKKSIIGSLLLIGFASVACTQTVAQHEGYYGDLKVGVCSEYHLRNIDTLISKSGIELTEYRLVEFMSNPDTIKYLTYNARVSCATLRAAEGESVQLEKIACGTPANAENKLKVFVVFYFQGADRKQTTYYLYRYG